jgi:predicted metal-dependent hydrolase
MSRTSPARITLDGRTVAYRLVRSDTARSLRVRVGPRGVEVVQPRGRTAAEARTFLRSRRRWVLAQVDRVAALGNVRRLARPAPGDILYRGRWTTVRVEPAGKRGGPNRVVHTGDAFTIHAGTGSSTPPCQSLENWLRKQARAEIERELRTAAQRLKVAPGRLYIMGQRTKWGNCSALGNLSFNWRLIMAPTFVLHYVVTHEAVHLAIPDHSRRFWLTVRSLCPHEERARQWLAANQATLTHALTAGRRILPT